MAKKRRLKKPEGQADQWSIPKKRVKGEAIFYDELKSVSVKVLLTPTATERFNQLAAQNKLSKSEYLERLFRKVDGLILP